MYFEILSWDSAFFGIRIAAISAGVSPADLATVVEKMREEGVKLAYWTTEPISGVMPVLPACHLHFADVRRTYSCALDSRKPGDLIISSFIERYDEDLPDEGLYELALQSGIHSRFRMDPRLGEEAYSALYRRWIEQSVAGLMADEVLFIEHYGKKAGMVSLYEKEGQGHIGLIAVDTDMRGRGLGRDLVRAAQVWAINRDYPTARVVTQQQNEAACRLYEDAGYQLESEKEIYHIWL